MEEREITNCGKKNLYSDDRLQKLKPLHKVVAREMAMGASLRDICDNRGLNISTWRQITTCALFLQEVERVGREIENEDIDDFVRDPVRLKLKNARFQAASRLVEEIDNFDKENTGASANTRLIAAKTVLEASGDLKAQETGPTVVINLQESVLKQVMGESKPLPPAPKVFTLSEANSGI